uniref:tRNA selenocysteine-associated protein 1 n=1 Tax=Schistosoma japonicum TaxID=6182 RepID=Q5DFV3_SCHJA|nr:SJCHGC04256 protein [Schistosoma japonicum]
MQNFSHTIWMGDLEPYMDEMFIKRAFETSGENIVSVKVIRNKATGQTLGYGFIEFANSTSARDAMLKLNGKLIPGAPVGFVKHVVCLIVFNLHFSEDFYLCSQSVLGFSQLHVPLFYEVCLRFSILL